MPSETTLHPDVIAAERLGDEIAELSAHIEVAMARLLSLIREFDALAGWANGFKSCAEWLSWRVGIDLNCHRVLDVASGHTRDRWGQRCREQRGLAGRGCIGKNTLYVRRNTAVEHFVSLVQDEH